MDSGFNMLGQFQGDTLLGIQPSQEHKSAEITPVTFGLGTQRALEASGQTADRYARG